MNSTWIFGAAENVKHGPWTELIAKGGNHQVDLVIVKIMLLVSIVGTIAHCCGATTSRSAHIRIYRNGANSIFSPRLFVAA